MRILCNLSVVKPILRIQITAAVLSLMPPPFIAAQSALQTLETIEAIRYEIETTRSYVPLQGTEATLLKGSSEAMAVIEEQWRATEVELPYEYKASLYANIDALRSARSFGNSAEKQLALLASINRDLQLKARYAGGTFGIIPMFRGAVKVTVFTLRGTQEEGGYLVRCNPRIHGLKSPALFIFSSASSPTTRTMPPGNFVLWLERSDGTVVTRQDIEVGSSNADAETIRVALP